MKAMHENSDVYDDPGKFIPERFLSNTKTIYASANGWISDQDQFNFGWGRRMCPDIYLAENEIFHVYIQLFSKCTIEPFIDHNNKLIYPDIEDEVNGGGVVFPASYKVKVIARS